MLVFFFFKKQRRDDLIGVQVIHIFASNSVFFISFLFSKMLKLSLATNGFPINQN